MLKDSYCTLKKLLLFLVHEFDKITSKNAKKSYCAVKNNV